MTWRASSRVWLYLMAGLTMDGVGGVMGPGGFDGKRVGSGEGLGLPGGPGGVGGMGGGGMGGQAGGPGGAMQVPMQVQVGMMYGTSPHMSQPPPGMVSGIGGPGGLKPSQMSSGKAVQAHPTKTHVDSACGFSA